MDGADVKGGNLHIVPSWSAKCVLFIVSAGDSAGQGIGRERGVESASPLTPLWLIFGRRPICISFIYSTINPSSCTLPRKFAEHKRLYNHGHKMLFKQPHTFVGKALFLNELMHMGIS